MNKDRWYTRCILLPLELIIFVVLIPVFFVLLLSGVALYFYDKRNKGLDN